VPYVFGTFCIFPISVALWQYYNHFDVSYSYNPGHLWFLGNIFAYVVLCTPLLYYMKKNQEGGFARVLRKLFSHPIGLLAITALFVIEAWVLKPVPYELYAMTWHGFALGFLAFLSGFCLVLAGQPFWDMLLKWQWMFPCLAVAAFVVRVIFSVKVPIYLLVAESHLWIFTCFAFGYKYLNHTGKVLRYLSAAAYPVYILHMVFLYAASLLIFPMHLPVQLKFIFVLMTTIAGCFGSYEIIKRVKFLRPLFGLKAGESAGIMPRRMGTEDFAAEAR
jgi:glucan biosynthesis protein C